MMSFPVFSRPGKSEPAAAAALRFAVSSLGAGGCPDESEHRILPVALILKQSPNEYGTRRPPDLELRIINV